ncbi:MAG: glycosyltransferase family 2 protein [Prosthecobacter sp.]
MVRRGQKKLLSRGRVAEPVISFVIPLFNTGDGLPRLIAAFEALELEDSWELVLVDDGSADATVRLAAQTMSRIKAPVILVELARNFGEHAAVLEGFRHAHGQYIISLDDDLQNPVAEAVKLQRHLQQTGADVVYSCYKSKQHHWFRNVGSRFVNRLASWLLGKPQDLYLSSFRVLRRSLVDRIITYRGPYPYIDGLILGATNRIERLQVQHVPRTSGQSGYTLRKLIRLVMSVLFDFSIMPLRIASVLGLALCGIGMVVLSSVVVEILFIGQRQIGWGSLMGALAVFSGAQLLMLGIIGEYLGRAFLTVSGKPQALVRAVTIHGGSVS